MDIVVGSVVTTNAIEMEYKSREVRSIRISKDMVRCIQAVVGGGF